MCMIRLIAENSDLQECLLLAKNGVPWDVVMDLDDIERRGFCIAAGIVEGGTFDWNVLSWRKPNG